MLKCRNLVDVDVLIVDQVLLCARLQIVQGPHLLELLFLVLCLLLLFNKILLCLVLCDFLRSKRRVIVDFF